MSLCNTCVPCLLASRSLSVQHYSDAVAAKGGIPGASLSPDTQYLTKLSVISIELLLIIPPPVGEAKLGYSDVYVHTFTVYTITRKILERSKLFVDTFDTLGEQEFVFGFCGSTRSLAVEIRAQSL